MEQELLLIRKWSEELFMYHKKYPEANFDTTRKECPALNKILATIAVDKSKKKLLLDMAKDIRREYDERNRK